VKKVVGVFVRFRAPLQVVYKLSNFENPAVYIKWLAILFFNVRNSTSYRLAIVEEK
jgi:hypothetical protein